MINGDNNIDNKLEDENTCLNDIENPESSDFSDDCQETALQELAPATLKPEKLKILFSSKVKEGLASLSKLMLDVIQEAEKERGPAKAEKTAEDIVKDMLAEKSQ